MNRNDSSFYFPIDLYKCIVYVYDACVYSANDCFKKDIYIKLNFLAIILILTR